jgi:hypothetical protein
LENFISSSSKFPFKNLKTNCTLQVDSTLWCRLNAPRTDLNSERIRINKSMRNEKNCLFWLLAI